ncbi:hypothetical protein QYE76_046864 [Lolium multiflorum]|uniref:CCHC-type domain-containing protein n=1 Tax=Lolium multiflorum TaxID=4521 RepID=A0AAD8TP46_LOLMU|nr:hypothetical protein QYE76_046864 [Lolium multiflorum]
MLCHTCGGKGHFKRDCPNRKVMIINEDNEYETGDDVDPNAPDDDDDTDGEDAYPYDARTIVVSQRALNVLPSASTQRCNLFQTKALVGPDKACKVIIDGGSCRNLASKELCTKLKLKYLPHPHPYYIQWLSDNGEMKEFGDVFPEEVPAGLPPLRVVNRTLSQLLRSMIKKNLKEWEECLPHVEFAYNRAVHSTTELCPFEVVYGFKPITPLDLLPLPIHERVNMEASKRADFVKKIHVKTKELIEKKGKSNAARMNKKRKEMLFKPGDLVWVHFRKDRFPKLRKSKLKPRGAGPYKVLAKINDNAYSIDLPEDEFGVGNSFNVADLTPYDGEDLGASGSTPFEGGDDEDIPTSLLPPSLPTEDEPVVKLKSNEVRIGPMTRARAKLLKQQVNLFLNDTLIDENFILPKSYYLCIIGYEEETSIARGGEEQLDVKMDVKLDKELDMKISHGRARRSGRNAREEKKSPGRFGAGQTGPHAGPPIPGPIGRPPAGGVHRAGKPETAVSGCRPVDRTTDRTAGPQPSPDSETGPGPIERSRCVIQVIIHYIVVFLRCYHPVIIITTVAY